MDLAEALELTDRELVALVGAGGKKTAMAHLAEQARHRGLRAGYTTTVRTPPPEYPLVVADSGELPGALDERFEGEEPPVLAFASREVENPDRAHRKVVGFDPGTVDRVFAAGTFDWLLVKADGARRRDFKAPGEDEPPVPGRSTVVVPVASVRAIGRPPTEEWVHRPERVRAITGLGVEEAIEPEDVGRVLASPAGGLKNVPDGARVVPTLNKADDDPSREAGRAALEAALARSERIDRGLVTSFRTGTVEVFRHG